MSDNRKTSDAAKILRGRYAKDDPSREASIQGERINAEVAQMIYDLRAEAGLTQKELADLAGTTQSAISRLEDTDYQGHSLSMLRKITTAMHHRLHISVDSREEHESRTPSMFRWLVHVLRRRKRLTVDQLAERTGVERDELARLERDERYLPDPSILRRLAEFYDIPEGRLAELAGVVGEVPENLQAQASRIATQFESFAALTRQEKHAVDDFVRVLREETA